MDSSVSGAENKSGVGDVVWLRRKSKDSKVNKVCVWVYLFIYFLQRQWEENKNANRILYKHDGVETHTGRHRPPSLCKAAQPLAFRLIGQKETKQNSKSSSSAAGKQRSDSVCCCFFQTFSRLSRLPSATTSTRDGKSERRGSFLPACQQQLQLQGGSALQLGGRTQSPSIRGSLQPD